MTTIYIKDRGIIKPGEESGSVFTGTSIVNAGTEIPLKGISLGYSRGMSYDDKPQPGAYEKPELNFVSITSPVITISGNIKDDGDLTSSGNVVNQITEGGTTSIKDWELSNTANEINMLFLLDKLCETRGYKEVYYKDATNNNNLVYGLGITDTGNTTYRHVHVLCKGLRITQNAGSSLITWTLTCEIMQGESV